MGKDAFLIFIFAIFGLFILLAVDLGKDIEPVNEKPEISIIVEEAISHVEEEIKYVAPKIIEPKQKQTQKVLEEVIEEEKEKIIEVEVPKIIYIPEVVLVEVPVYIPPLYEAPVGAVEDPIIENIMTEEVQKTYTLEIISPMAGKGLGRKYLSSDTVADEFNYLEIAVIVREDGEAKNDSLVKVVCTDESQNKQIASTGFQAKIYVDGVKQFVPAYFFHYEFKEAGNQTITFFAEGKEITTGILEVAVDERG